jgi:hypothetical protein
MAAAAGNSIAEVAARLLQQEVLVAAGACLICSRSTLENIDAVSCMANHRFHAECLVRWILSGRLSCPFCDTPHFKQLQEQ